MEKKIINYGKYKLNSDDLFISHYVLRMAGEALPQLYDFRDLDTRLDPNALKIIKDSESELTIEFQVNPIVPSWKGKQLEKLTVTRTINKKYLRSSEDYECERKAKEAANAKREAEQKALWQQKYDKAFAFAKEKKVKGIRKGTKKARLLEKIKEAGYDYKW